MTEFQLNWTSFKNNLCNSFSQLQQNEEFVDMTLAADGHLVRVHRNIVSVASPYIKEMLQSTACRDPVVFLNNVSSHVLSYILEYIYTGEVKVPKHAISTFIQAAKSLHITGIKDLVAPQVPQELSQPLSEIFSKRCGTLGHPTATVETYSDDKSTTTQDGNSSKLPDLDPQNHSDSNNINSDDNNLDASNIDQMDVDFAQAQTTQGDTQISESQAFQEKSLLDKALENIITVDSNEADQNVQYKANITLNFEDDGGVKIQNDGECGANVPKFNVQIQSCPRNNGDDPALSISVNKNTQNAESVPDSFAKVNTEGETHDASAPLYSISNRGSLQLILNRFIYNMHHSSYGNTKHRWRCADYRKLNCKAYIDTSFDEIVERKNEHTHGFHDAKIVKKGTDQNIYSTMMGAEEAVAENMITGVFI